MKWQRYRRLPDRELLVDDTDDYRCIRQLLSQARDRRASGPRRQRARRRDLSSQFGDEMANRSPARTATCFTSTKASCRQSMPFGRLRSTTRRAFKWRTRSIASPSAAGCRSNTTRTARLISTSRTKVAGHRARKRTGCPLPKEHFNLTMRLYSPKKKPPSILDVANGIRRGNEGREVGSGLNLSTISESVARHTVLP